MRNERQRDSLAPADSAAGIAEMSGKEKLTARKERWYREIETKTEETMLNGT